MPKASPLLSSFNAGVLSPHLEGRVDVGKYANGCKFLENYVPLIQGPVKRRGSFRFVAEVKSSASRTWLVRFEFNTQQAYVLEFGDLYIRFYTNHGQVTSGGPAYEIVSPYSASDLTASDGTFNLRFVESADIVYITHQSYAPHKLARLSAVNWTLTTLVPVGGPFKAQSTTTTTVYASAAAGTGITVTASAAIFLAGHVGSLFYIEQKSVLDIKAWEAGKSISIGDLRRSNGVNYKALNTATTGGSRPIHTSGAAYDGDSGVQWEFQDPGFGVVKITGFTSTTIVTADVISQIPDNAVTAGKATTRWAHAAWSDVEGWPSQVTFYKERLVFGRDQTVWLSVAGDYETFTAKDDGGLVVADMAITIQLQSDQVNKIRWMVPGDSLLIGTAGGEFALRSLTDQQPFGPENVTAPQVSSYGSRSVVPVKVGEYTLFVQRSGTKLRDIIYDYISNKFQSADQTVLADHVSKGGITQIAYQQEPYSILFSVRADGRLLGFTYNKEQDVQGWHPHRVGGAGIVESICTIPAPNGDRDELWTITRRTINGVTRRYIEFMEYERQLNDDPEDSFYVDCGLTLNNTINATLTPGATAITAHATGVVFTTGSAIFVSDDVGREIHYRYSVSGEGDTLNWHTAKAVITSYTDNKHVTCTINAAFPSVAAIAANGWRMTVTTISGLSHLEGATVDILADGATHPRRTVSAGAITLQTASSKVHVGFRCPAKLQTMRLNAGAADGTSQGKTARINKAAIRLLDTLGLKYGSEFSALDEVPFRSAADPMDGPPALFTGDKILDWPGDYNENPWLCFQQDDPLPSTIVGVMPQDTVYDR